MIVDVEKYSLLLEIHKIVFNMYLKTYERMMYGKILFSHESEDFSSLFFGNTDII